VNFSGQFYADPGDRLSIQGGQLGFAKGDAALFGESFAVGLADEEVGSKTVVLDQECAAGFEPPIELHDGSVSMDTVRGLEDYAVVHRMNPSRRKSWKEDRERGRIG